MIHNFYRRIFGDQRIKIIYIQNLSRILKVLIQEFIHNIYLHQFDDVHPSDCPFDQIFVLQIEMVNLI